MSIDAWGQVVLVDQEGRHEPTDDHHFVEKIAQLGGDVETCGTD